MSKKRQLRSTDEISPSLTDQLISQNNVKQQPISQSNANQASARQINPRKLVVGNSENSRSKIAAAGVFTK